MAAPVILVLLVCLILTKSRSAWLGLLVATIVLAWRARAAGVGAGAGGRGRGGRSPFSRPWSSPGCRARLLDREVLTQSTMSLRYRWEYWQGAWGVISGGATSVMAGLELAVFLVGRRAGQFWRALPEVQAAAVERGDSRPAQPVSRGLGDGRRLGVARPGGGAVHADSGTCSAPRHATAGRAPTRRRTSRASRRESRRTAAAGKPEPVRWRSRAGRSAARR